MELKAVTFTRRRVVTREALRRVGRGVEVDANTLEVSRSTPRHSLVGSPVRSTLRGVGSALRRP